MSVGQMMNSSPAGWSRPAVKRQQRLPGPAKQAPSRHRVTGPWARLWAPELIAGLWALCWLWVTCHPRPTIPVPVHFFSSPTDMRVWWRSLVWHSTGHIVLWWAIVASVVVLVALADFVLLRNRRLARRLRWRWERAARREMGEVPRLRRIRVHDGVVDAKVILRSEHWKALETALDVDRGPMLRGLKLSRSLGSPFRAAIFASGHSNPARTRSLRLYYKPLGLPDTFPPYEKPADGAKLFVGHSVDGPVMIDLGEAPHVQVVGDSGTGKGQFISVQEGQVLRAFWLLMVIDGGASPEYAPLDPAPTVMRPMRIEQTLEERLKAAILAVKLLTAMSEARSAITEAFGVQRPDDLPPDVIAWLPRIGVVVDETTKLLAPSKSAKNKALNDLRAELAAVLDTDVLRSGRKFRIHVLPLADQFAYSLVFSRGAQNQAGHVVVMGNLADNHVRQTTGLDEGLPAVPEVPRCGHYVRFGNPRIHEIRLPFHPDSLKRAVAYVVEQTSRS